MPPENQARLGDNEYCEVASGPCAMFPSESFLRFSTLQRGHFSVSRFSMTGCPTIHSLSPAGTSLLITRDKAAPVFSVHLTICLWPRAIASYHGPPRTPFLPRGLRPERPECSPCSFQAILIGHGIYSELYFLVCESDVMFTTERDTLPTDPPSHLNHNPHFLLDDWQSKACQERTLCRR